MHLPRAVAVDGPAGSGKSTVCFAVARDLGYLFVDTGAFYRMITLQAVEAGLAQAPEEKILALAQQSTMDISPRLVNDGNLYTALLNGQDVTSEIRAGKVEDHVSPISSMPKVRQLVNDLQQEIIQRGNVIMAGRDIGTVVIPDADFKIYLTASLEVRAQRRFDELKAKGKNPDLAKIKQELYERDLYDSSRAVAPLRRPADAIYIDSSDMTLDQTIEYVKSLIVEWHAPENVKVES